MRDPFIRLNVVCQLGQVDTIIRVSSSWDVSPGERPRLGKPPKNPQPHHRPVPLNADGSFVWRGKKRR